MEEQNRPSEEDHQTNVETLSAFIKTYIDQQIQNAIKQHDESQPKIKKWRNSWRSASPITKAGVVLTFAVAIATIAYSLIAWRQLNAMQVISAGNAQQTQQLIEAANQIKVAAWEFKGSAQSINENVGNAVKTLQSQVEQMDASRRSADKNSAVSMQATIDNFHNEQRAWISAQPATGAPKENPPYKIQFPISNTGRTPAKNVIVYFNGNWVIRGQELTYSFKGVPVAMAPVAPGPTTTFSYNAPPDTHNDPSVVKNMLFYVYGAITYDDVFKKGHWLTYCFFVTEGDTYAYCREHNDTGDGPLPPNALQ
jgi:hypothetical protein